MLVHLNCFSDSAKSDKNGHVKKRLVRKTRLKVQSCKLFNNKYMITSTQITNTEIFVFITVLVKLLEL